MPLSILSLLNLAQVAPTAPVNWYVVLLDHLLSIVVAVVVAVLPFLVKKAADAFAKKWHWSLTEYQQIRVAEMAAGAVAYADEAAHKALKSLGTKVSGPEKLNLAVQYLAERIEKAGLEKRAAEELEKLILSSLGYQRSVPHLEAVSAIPAPPPTTKEPIPVVVVSPGGSDPLIGLLK